MRRQMVLALLVAASVSSEARAGLFFHKTEGTPPPGKPRWIEHSLERAGHPLSIAPHAVPSNTPHYNGSYVGGGSAHGGDPRFREEGTWGWDYLGGCLTRRVFLDWSHGRRAQGGTGAYRTDGHPVPDVFSGGH